jgi:hypothetical protein
VTGPDRSARAAAGPLSRLAQAAATSAGLYPESLSVARSDAPLPPAVSPGDEFAWHAETVHLLVLSRTGAILRWNGAAAAGLAPHGVLREGEPVWGLLAGNSASLLRECLERAGTGPVRCLLTFTDGERFAHTLSCSLHPRGDTVYLFGEHGAANERRMNTELMALTNELAETSRERARLNARLEKTLADLEASHWHIRKFQEHLPICSVCHKVATGKRDDAGWESLMMFLANNGLFMSHGYCPECEAAAFAELDEAVPPDRSR